MHTIAIARGRGRPATPVIEFPERLWDEGERPSEFHLALDFEMRRHGDNVWRLFRAMKAKGGLVDRTTITAWRRGFKAPRTPATLHVLTLIEARYRLPKDTLQAMLASHRAICREAVPGVPPSEARRLAWHLPEDFGERSALEREEILNWVRSTVLSGGTSYGRYHARVSRHRFSLQLNDTAHGARAAPAQLRQEMADLVRFKTITLVDQGYERSGVWGAETADQRTEHFGLLFGALAAAPDSEVAGLGVPPARLSFALLVFPAVWDWYLRWREARRGFFTGWEVDMLLLAAAFTREGVGWLLQSPALAGRLSAIPSLVSEEDVSAVQRDWTAACNRLRRHALARAREIKRVARIHRDPFEPLLPVLEAESPVGEYRKITEEILVRMPDGRRYPRARAEAVRGFLMLRVGLHTGLRQKNLRQLLFRHRGQPPTAERELEAMKRGELRWNDREQGWEVFVPCAAFKNADSGYFSRKPFRLRLPDLGGLYGWIESYLATHRALLLGLAQDPGTFFVKTVKRTSRDAAYNQTTFYEAWRLTIQRYGIHNPYTGRGVIKGLLPHGPHSVRDVLATHVLKQTGSYEQASYAIQDTPATVAKHYGRFLPQDKAALAAQLLNQAWEAV